MITVIVRLTQQDDTQFIYLISYMMADAPLDIRYDDRQCLFHPPATHTIRQSKPHPVNCYRKLSARSLSTLRGSSGCGGRKTELLSKSHWVCVCYQFYLSRHMRLEGPVLLLQVYAYPVPDGASVMVGLSYLLLPKSH